ncbi:hypothetical protein EV360DRAFT_90812 [Lentinula raphanica]|nr:hypothetical protein EV360DRAFT_90812 [Lentinula raphanica]
MDRPRPRCVPVVCSHPGLPVSKLIYVFLFLSALVASPAVQHVPLSGYDGHTKAQIYQIIRRLQDGNLLWEERDYKFPPQEKVHLLKPLEEPLSEAKDYGTRFGDMVSLMAGSGEYKGHDRANLIIKNFYKSALHDTRRVAAILGEIHALKLKGDLVDFGMNVEGHPVIIMKRKEGSHLYEMEAFKNAEPEERLRMVRQTLALACGKTASEAVTYGFLHLDVHSANVLSDSEIKHVDLIDYGRIFFVDSTIRLKEYQPIFEKYCLFKLEFDWELMEIRGRKRETS